MTDGYRCSKCGAIVSRSYLGEETEFTKANHYCPNCGEFMQGRRMDDFYEGEYIIYRNGEKYELGRITSLKEDGAFVCYHEGETAAKTPYSRMRKLINAHVIKATSLGGSRFQEAE